jgi:hypothetical protein
LVDVGDVLFVFGAGGQTSATWTRPSLRSSAKGRW